MAETPEIQFNARTVKALADDILVILKEKAGTDAPYVLNFILDQVKTDIAVDHRAQFDPHDWSPKGHNRMT